MILTARRLYGNQAGKWEFPGGKYEEGESGRQAIAREIREEFEVEMEVGELVCTIRHRYPEFNLVMDCFLCSLKGDELRLHDHSEIQWIRPNKRGIEWAEADRKVIRAYRRYLKESK